MRIVAVIPAYRPGAALIELVARLGESNLAAIVVVDDGSGPAFAEIFRSIEGSKVRVLRHAVNLGKGAALKAGFNYALCDFPDLRGVVTADADGQHDPRDILRVAQRLNEQPGVIVLGAREFGEGVPRRSKTGNLITRSVVRLLVGQNLRDTQTGLRGVPAALLPDLLKIPSSGYEYELDMLVAAKHRACPIVEQPIRTIYEDGNRSSHFNPVRDSMKIYFVLLRFSALSLLTAVVDNLVFLAFYGWTGSVWQSQVVGRSAAVLFNYAAARKAVFLSDARHRTVLPKYLLLVAASGLLSYGLIDLLHTRTALPIVWAKLCAESILFFINFIVQRDLVFTRRRASGIATDWTAYYESTPPTAKLTRKYTTKVLVDALARFGGREQSIVEIGGANSCFLDRILADIRPVEYHVIDTNEYGLELLRRRTCGSPAVVMHGNSVLDLDLKVQADTVFSVGLIEHFNPAQTRKAVEAHFALLKPGGCAIISFPTPTWLYRSARFACEAAGIWRFPDERPLRRHEVLASATRHGEVVFEKTLWPLVFTQHMMVFRKKRSAAKA
jgi:glycosyltransferase involved in cell wall biosynthesis/SAM-dependent methyltransferase